MAEKAFMQKPINGIWNTMLFMGLTLALGFMMQVPSANAATYTVINTDDAGAGSLRQAIIDANANAGLDTINFDGTLSGTITTASDLTAITEEVIIAGETANDALNGPDIIIDASGRTWCLQFTAGDETVLRGIACRSGTNGLHLTSALSGITVGGTGSRDGNTFDGATQAGIYIDGADNVTIINNDIGTVSANSDGIFVENTATGIVIGGDTSDELNIIVSNTDNGIELSECSATITGNYIGTSTGSNDAGNTASGIFIGADVTSTTIGGTAAGERNIISGNNTHGIWISDSGDIDVINNYIGINAAGTAAIANTQNGIYIESSSNTIGGTTTSHRNVISGNTNDGIEIDGTTNTANTNSVLNNYIGLNATGTGAIANGQAGIRITGNNADSNIIGLANQGNTISGNTGYGIIIETTGATGTTIKGNVIGLLVDGDTIQGNGLGGIQIVGDSSIVGGTGTSENNVISGNDGVGVWLNGSDSSIVYNNSIGVAAYEATVRSNGGHGISIGNTASSNIIGNYPAVIGSQNAIAAASDKYCVYIISTAGNNNTVRGNTCQNTNLGAIERTGTTNGNISTPTIDAVLSTTSYLTGTGPANASIDIYSNGVYSTNTTVDAEGVWSKNISVSSGEPVDVAATDATGNTSSTVRVSFVEDDLTAPSAPTVSSPVNDSSINTSPTTLLGTKEAYSSIWINGVEQVTVNESTSWSVAGIVLVEGNNNFTILSKDYSNNSSGEFVYLVVLDTSVPAAPTLSYPSTSTSTAIITGSGTEFGAHVYVNGIDSGALVDALGNFSVSVLVQPGLTSQSITIVDDAGNTSTASVASITNTSGGGSSGSSSSSSPSVGDDDEEAQSMAGEAETQIENNEDNTEDNSQNNATEDSDAENSDAGNSSTENDSISSSDNSSSSQNQDVRQNQGTRQNEIRSFYSGIYQYVEPIKIPSVRDSYPVDPVKPPKYENRVFNNKFFGSKNSLGIPHILINIKAKGREIVEGRDSDNDGAYDSEELFYGTNLDVADTDGDGIKDGDEIYLTNTDPADYDSDGDKIADSVDSEPSNFTVSEISSQEVTTYVREEEIEIGEGSTLMETLGIIDSDEDGLSDLSEFYIETDPQDEDSDSDGLSDGDEVMHYGTDPNTSTKSSSVESLSVVNLTNGETVEATQQLFIGHVGLEEAEDEPTVQAYEILEDGEMNLVGESTADENGRYLILTDTDFTEGSHSFIITSGKSLDEISDMSGVITLNMVNHVKRPEYVSLGLQNGSKINDSRPSLALTAADNYMIIVVWRSTIYSQILIADAAGQNIQIRPVENLELGEHTVTWYAQNLETGAKSAPSQLTFEVTKTAFVTGENTSPWIILLGSIAALASLSTLALFFRNRKMKA